MKPDVLVNGRQMPHVMERLEERYVLHKLHEAEDVGGFLQACGAKIRAVATGGGQGASAALIDALPNLEIISSVGVGTDSIDVEHARKRGILVANTPDVLNDD